LCEDISYTAKESTRKDREKRSRVSPSVFLYDGNAEYISFSILGVIKLYIRILKEHLVSIILEWCILKFWKSAP